MEVGKTEIYKSKEDQGSKYLIIFAQEHLDFRIQELQSISSMFDISLNDSSLSHDNKSPFLVIDLEDESAAKRLASRSILTKSVLKLFGAAESSEQLYKILEQYASNELLSYSRKDDSFRINVESFNKKITQEKKLAYIQSLSFLPLDGDVNLSNPATTFFLILDHSNTTKDDPQFFFGRLIANGQRHLLKHYSLKTRHFIGNTSMDPQLSLVMANMAKCQNGMLVYDPFVGTGSVLIACSHYGSYSFGSDIDRTLLLGRGHPTRAQAVGKWRGKDESVLSNFKMYNLHAKYVDVWMGDQMNTALRTRPMFDAIVTDPPYGIREGSKTLVVGNPQINETQEEKGPKLPGIKGCVLSEALYSLLEFSAHYLVMNGRLVFWLPVYRPTYSEQNIPSHPCLKLLYNCEQVLSPHVSRRLITMEKITNSPERQMNVVDDRLRSIHDQFRNNYFRLKEESPGGT